MSDTLAKVAIQGDCAAELHRHFFAKPRGATARAFELGGVTADNLDYFVYRHAGVRVPDQEVHICNSAGMADYSAINDTTARKCDIVLITYNRADRTSMTRLENNVARLVVNHCDGYYDDDLDHVIGIATRVPPLLYGIGMHDTHYVCYHPTCPAATCLEDQLGRDQRRRHIDNIQHFIVHTDADAHNAIDTALREWRDRVLANSPRSAQSASPRHTSTTSSPSTSARDTLTPSPASSARDLSSAPSSQPSSRQTSPRANLEQCLLQ